MFLLIRFLLPLLYTVIVAGAFGICFKKRLEEAMAPAFLVQALLMLITAMVFNSLSIGLYIAVTVAFIYLIARSIKEKNIEMLAEEFIPSKTNIGPLLILIFYSLVFIKNIGCTYSGWDEFSHWGMFVKEMFRLDALYCTSPASMAHKDYVPAISIFEMLWCKLSLRYSEADAYRGIQMLQGAMMLPLITIGNKHGKVFDYIKRVVIVFGIPLFFDTFYHTIYQDLIYGILVFYCMYIIVVEKESLYKDFIMTISLIVLVLSKMTAMAFLPMIVLFYIVWTLKFEETSLKKKLPCIITLLLAPVALWIIFNKYVDVFVPNSGGNQSYDGMGISALISVITHDGAITWQHDVEVLFFKSLFTEGVVQILGFIPFIVVLAIALVFASKSQSDNKIAKKVNLINLWMFLASIAYTIMMYYLYTTAFGEYEARKLASYSRYMQTMALAAVYLVILVFMLFENEKIKKIQFVISVVVIENIVFFLHIGQLVPGVLKNERIEYESEAEAIISHSDEQSSVCLITCRANGSESIRINYLCAPRKISWMSPGPSRYDGDVWSNDMDIDAFISYVSGYDMIYLWTIDDEFQEKYSEAFANPESIAEHRLYYVSEEAGKIKITDVED